MSKDTGRPNLKLDYNALDALLQHKITKKFCAEYLNISETTIDNKLREDHDMTFTEYHALRMERVSTKLQQKAISMASNGNIVMLIFCLKNISKWQDKIEIEGTLNVNTFTDWAAKTAKQLEAKENKAIDVTPKENKDD